MTLILTFFACLKPGFINIHPQQFFLHLVIIYIEGKDWAQGEGGALIYAKYIVNCKEIHASNENGLELICLDITLSPQRSFVLIVIYRPPLSNIDFYEKLDNLLKQCNFQKEVIIMGDLNINWEDKHIGKI